MEVAALYPHVGEWHINAQSTEGGLQTPRDVSAVVGKT